MTTIQTEELWKSLEADALAGKTTSNGWLLRLARPTTNCPLFVGLELCSKRRAIMLRLPPTSMPSRRIWPRSKGLESFSISIDGDSHFGVSLKDSKYSDVFAALTEDLVRRIIESGTPSAQAHIFLGQLARWQKFLSASSEGLSEELQRGLWGELYFLREVLLPAFGSQAVDDWKGGEHAHQDFQMETGAVEVKTTLAKLPQVVRITSERQLDDGTLPALFLNVIALDTREDGETLPAMVSSIRGLLAGDPAGQERFEDELLEANYLDLHTARYTAKAYAVRAINFFRVEKGFPRIVESDMPAGTGDANYALSVSACESFRVTKTELTDVLAGKQKHKSKGRKNV